MKKRLRLAHIKKTNLTLLIALEQTALGESEWTPKEHSENILQLKFGESEFP